jgi:hypothetical protein
MATFQEHFATWTGSATLRDAIIAELEAMPKDWGEYSTPVYQKKYTNHRWYPTKVFEALHDKHWERAIAFIKEVDPEFYARYATEQPTEQPNYRALYEQAQRDIAFLKLKVNHLKDMVELYKSFR